MAARRSYPAAFKAKVVLSALREDKPLAQVAAEQGVHPNQLRRWRQTAVEELPRLFAGDSPRERQKQLEQEQLLEQLYTEIGRLTTQLAWLKKKVGEDGGPS
jgi:transposase